MKKFFFTTNNEGIFYLLTEAAKKNLLDKKNNMVESKVIKKKMPSLSFYFFLINIFITGKIFDARNFGYLKYKNYSVGKHVLAETRSFYISYQNKIIYFMLRLKLLFSAARIVDTAISIKDHSAGIFIDHVVYLNGLYFEVFYKNKKIIYANGFPKGFFKINGEKNIKKKIRKTDELFKINTPKKLTKNQKKQAAFKINRTLKNPKNIPYLSNANFKKIKNRREFSDVTHVVYAHSFTDAQLAYGFDGFSDTEDWLLFTIKELSKLGSKIIIKGHPNFYNFKFGDVSKVDNKIFQRIVRKFSNNKNLIFINNPIKNIDLLKQLSKKTILITHHGTTIFDANLKKFKIISSSETFYKKNIKICSSWDNIYEYKKLLKLKYNELTSDYSKILNISYGLYFDKFNLYGKYFFIKTINKYIKPKNLKLLDKNLFTNYNITNKTNIENLVSELALKIEEINLT